MSTTHCGTNIVRIRVGLLNDILRFDYALRIFFFISSYCELSASVKNSTLLDFLRLLALKFKEEVVNLILTLDIWRLLALNFLEEVVY